MGTPRLEQFKGVLERRGVSEGPLDMKACRRQAVGVLEAQGGAFAAAGGGAAGFGARRSQVDLRFTLFLTLSVTMSLRPRLGHGRAHLLVPNVCVEKVTVQVQQVIMDFIAIPL